MSERSVSETARQLREAFDRAFAEAVAEKPKLVNLLSVRVGGAPYAFRLDEIAGLHRDRSITRCVSPLPELLGMAGFRGVIVPVYDLAALLGHARSDAPRWLVLSPGEAPIAFAFETFEAHVRVEPGRLTTETPSSARPHVNGALSDAGVTRAVIRVASLVEAIVSRARSGGSGKER